MAEFLAQPRLCKSDEPMLTSAVSTAALAREDAGRLMILGYGEQASTNALSCAQIEYPAILF